MAESIDPDHAAHGWFRDRNRRMREDVTGAFIHAQRQGELRADIDAAVAATQFAALFDGLVIHWALDREAFDVAERVEQFVALLRPRERGDVA